MEANKICLMLSLLLLMFGCSPKEIGRDLVSGGLEVVREQQDRLAAAASKLGGGVVAGAIDSLTEERQRKRLQGFTDSLVLSLGNRATEAATQLVDSVGFHARRQVNAIGRDAERAVDRLLDSAVGAKTGERLGALLAHPDVLKALGTVRDTLLGTGTQVKVQGIVDSAMTSFIRRYRDDISPMLRSDLGFIQKNATELLALIALLAFGIIAYVWRQKQLYRRSLTVLTHQIHEIPDQKAYDELTKRINSASIQQGIEKRLRTILHDEGINQE
jgi:hypothetical protein